MMQFNGQILNFHIVYQNISQLRGLIIMVERNLVEYTPEVNFCVGGILH